MNQLCVIVWFTLTLNFWYVKLKKQTYFFLRLGADFFFVPMLLQVICNKFIEIKKIMFWPWCCLLQKSQRQKICQTPKYLLHQWFVPITHQFRNSCWLKWNEICTCYFFHNHSFPLITIVFCYQNCSDLLWAKIVLVIEKNFWNSRLQAKNLQNFWDH